MKTIELELRITYYGSVLAMEVLLEDQTDKSKTINGWQQGPNYFFKYIPYYPVLDSVLNVYVGCQGIAGGVVICEVLINRKNVGKVISRVENRKYAEGAFRIS